MIKKYVYSLGTSIKVSRASAFRVFYRSKSSKTRRSGPNDDHMKVAYYTGAAAILVFGAAYASVPLYKVFCQVTGFGGTTQRADELKANTVKPVDGGRVIRVDFTSNVHSTIPWDFRPTQKSLRLVPGETALAFYTVRNRSDKAITGVATYNVFPSKAGLYFNKIQCFCFEEQRLQPGEEVDMPVFFFLDPALLRDPTMDHTHVVTLAYTFFKTGEEAVEAPAQDVTAAARSSGGAGVSGGLVEGQGQSEAVVMKAR